MKDDGGLRQALYDFRATPHGDQVVLPMPIALARSDLQQAHSAVISFEACSSLVLL